MGYLHINNLYKDQTILMFKECYALEKIHGTSAHIKWKWEEKRLIFFSGGEKYERFKELFDEEFLYSKFSTEFSNTDVTIFGEAYGGKMQGMKSVYGESLKFIVFDVQIDGYWLEVPNAEKVSLDFNLEFVDYVRIPTDLEKIDTERDRDSQQAIRNGVGIGKLREGVILRPIKELQDKNGNRIISKHKRDEFMETKTKREVSSDQLKVLEDAELIAEEWVTDMRLTHVLDKLSNVNGLESTGIVIKAMVEDIYREGSGEVVESKEVSRAIGAKTVKLFKKRIQTI